MSQRTLTLSRTLRDFAGNPVVGAAVTVQPLVPGNALAIDGNGFTVESQPPLNTTTNSSGVWSIVADYPGDFATANVQIRITENGTIIDSPAGGFAYASTVDPTAWVAALSTTGKVRMRLVYTTDGGVPVPNARVTIPISQMAIDPNGAQVASSAAGSVQGITDSTGTFPFWVWPSAALNPITTFYTARIAGESGTLTFTAPTAADFYQGAYNSATTYHAASGTSAGDVVLSGGVLYRAIATTTGNAPPNGTYWQVVSGLPTDLITQHYIPASAPGTLSTQAGNIVASANVGALADDPINPAASLDDQLVNLAARAGLALRTVTASTTVLAADDWIVADATAGNITLTLLAASARVRPLTVIRKDAGANMVTIARAGSDTINGATSLALNTQYLWAVLKPGAGTAWYAQTGTGGAGSVGDATTTAVGGVVVDQSPATGHPVALTVPRLGASAGVAPLGGDAQVPSAFLPTPTGSTAEAGRWVKAGSPILSPATWEGGVVAENSIVIDPTQLVMAYRGGWSTTGIGIATCPLGSDPTVGANWTRYGSNPIYGTSGNPQQPHLVKFGTTYYLYFAQGGAWKVAATTSLTSWPAASTALAAGGGVTQWANSSVIRDPDGTWHALLEGLLIAGTWAIHLLTSSDGLTWAVGNGGAPLSTLQVHSGGAYGGPNLLPYKVDGLYHVWYHAAPGSGNLPTYIYHATSPDLVTWTQKASNPVLDLTGEAAGIDQVAGPGVFELRGTAYLAYDHDNNTAQTANIGIASVAGATLHQVLNGSLPASTGTVTSVGVAAPGTVTNPTTTPVITFPLMGASGSGHSAGLVPDPGSTAGTTHYLREDGTWAAPPGTGSGNPSAHWEALTDLQGNFIFVNGDVVFVPVGYS